MKKPLIVTAISLSAMFGTNASAQLLEVVQNDQELLAARGNGTTRGSSSSSSYSSGSSSSNSTRSASSSSSSSSNSSSYSSNGGSTSRGRLQNSSRGGSDTRGTKPGSNSESNSSTSRHNDDRVRNNQQPRHNYSEVRGHRHHDDVIIYESGPVVEEYVVVNEPTPTASEVLGDHINPVMADAYFGLNVSSLGDNDENIGFCAGISGEFGPTHPGYYGRIGARYSKQNFEVYYGNDWFPYDMSEVSIKTIQIPVTLAGYRYGDNDVCVGAGIGLLYQHGLSGTTESEYHTQDYWDWRHEPYPEPRRERKNTFSAGIMSRNDLQGLCELYFRIYRLTISAEASVSFLNNNHFPNKTFNWDCSRNLTVSNVMLSVGFRMF